MELSQAPKLSPFSGAESSLMAKKRIFIVRYLECKRNHAITLGGHATDGCMEFLPAGEEGSAEALKCAACSCHRNFHRKETEGDITYQVEPQPLSQSPDYRVPAPEGFLPVSEQMVVTYEHVGHQVRDEQVYVVSPISIVEGKKRFCTKFTSKQKAMMQNFAESIGWKIQKGNKANVVEFCASIGVDMQVLKVWLNNNKKTLGKKHEA